MRKLKTLFYNYSWLIWLIVVQSSLVVPLDIDKKENNWVTTIPYLDKVVHFILFFILFLLVATATCKMISKYSVSRKYIFVILYALITEVIQKVLAYRTFEIFDIIANIMGATIAYLLFNRITKLKGL